MITLQSLENPGIEYRPVPFWSWNDKLDPEMLRWQIREMHKAGLGGFFMHARGGLQTEYLSEEWMTCVFACLDEAKKLGMEGWLYDENGWPSGFGGGIVNGLGLKYQQKYLRVVTGNVDELRKKDHIITWFSEDGESFLGRELSADFTGNAMLFYFDVNLYYVDNLDAEVTAEFIRVTHQMYYDRIPEELRSSLKGIFTDEPQLSRNGIPWSFVLEKEFSEAYGGDLIQELPKLFFEKKGFAALRVKFWRLCAILFREHFLKQIYGWCESHHWMLTGHHVLEEPSTQNITANGSIMAQYEYYSMPGMDHLCRTLPNIAAMVQLESACAQFGKKQVLTESFALTGWNCNFTGQRWIYHYQLAHNVNRLCQHLSGYSLRGLRKRDYPSSAFYHQPWWSDYSKMNDYFSRLGMLLANGENSTDTLVIHPLSSLWINYSGYTETLEWSGNTQWSWESVLRELEKRQIHVHLCDEIIAEEKGTVIGTELRIGKCVYHRVVIPGIQNLSKHVCEMLMKFSKAGGLVVRVKPEENKALTIDGSPASNEILDWYLSLPVYDSEAEMADFVAESMKNVIPMVSENNATASDICSTVRDYQELNGKSGRLFYFASLKYEDGRKLHFSLPECGAGVELFDATTGKFSVLAGVTKQNGRFEFDYYLGAADALVVFVPAAIWAENGAQATNRKILWEGIPLTKVRNCACIGSCSENILTLDRCRYRVNDGEWKNEDMISLQALMLTYRRDIKLTTAFEFSVSEDFDLATSLTLLVEKPEWFSFSLNGHDFKAVDSGYMFDSAFRKVALPAVLKHGVNTLELTMMYHQPQDVYDKLEKAKVFESEYNTLTFDREIESVYLAGAFEVRHFGKTETLLRSACRYFGTFELAPQKLFSIDCKDLVASGYPFFAGTMALEFQLSLTEEEAKMAKFLKFAPFGANSWKIHVNGKEAGDCFWAPWMVPVAGLLQMGENNIEIEFATSLRNMLGPHHLEEGESYVVHTMSFNKDPNPVGYKPEPYNSGYCFVNLGIEDITLIG